MNNKEIDELEKADQLAQKGDYDAAVAKLQILMTSADSDVRDMAENYLANTYASSGRNEEAESMLRQSIAERGPDNEGLAWQLAVLAPVVRRLGRSREAEDLYQQALALMRPDEAELKAITMRNLAYLCWSTGRIDEARQTLEAVLIPEGGFTEFLTGVMKPYLEPEIPA